MQKTLVDLFELRSQLRGDDPPSIEIEIEIEEPPPTLPPTRGPRAWLSEE